MNCIRIWPLILLISILSTVACSPCRQLANLICECEKTLNARENCKKLVDVRGNSSVFDFAVDQKVCQDVLDKNKCTCEAISKGDVDQCGMTRDPL